MKAFYKNYVIPYWKSIFGILALSIGQIGLQVAIITLTKRILNQGIYNNDFDIVIHIGLSMLVMTVVYGLFVVAVSYLSAHVSASVTCKMRKDLFSKILNFSQADYEQFGGATLMSRITADTTRVQIFMINFLRSALLAPMAIVALIIATAVIDSLLCMVLTGSFLIIIAFMIIKSKITIPFFNEVQNKLDELNQLLKEKIDGARTVRAFNKQAQETKHFEKVNNDYKIESYNASVKLFYLTPFAMIVMNLAVLLIYYLGSIELQRNLIEITDLILFFQYVSFFITCLGIVPFIVTTLPKTIVSVERLQEVLRAPLTITDELVEKWNRGADITPANVANTSIEFEDVSFGYGNGKNILEHINLKIKDGTKTAIIGPTGSGKSTLVNLIVRAYEVRSGCVKIKNCDIRNIELHALRAKIAYAAQKTAVLNESVYDNVSMGQTLSEEKVWKSCELSMFTEALKDMPNGIHTVMARNGMNVSGGQKQRLSLARTIAKDADIYIFDDCFSALDANTEKKVRSNVAQYLNGKTVLMVAQKINTIRDADLIIVMNEGKIVQRGTHEKLLKTCSLYQEINETQNYDKEEANEKE